MKKIFSEVKSFATKFSLPSGPDFTINGRGYNIRETNFAIARIGQSRDDTGVVDTYEILKDNTRQGLVDCLIRASEKPQALFGEIFVYPHDPEGFIFLDKILENIVVLQSEGFPLRRIIIPLNLAFSSQEKTNHAATLCIEKNRKDSVAIVILEQHKRTDGSDMDFSQEIYNLMRYLESFYHLRQWKTKTFTNAEPFCPEKNMCGLVSLEICKRLLECDRALDFVQNHENLQISHSELEALHRENVALAQQVELL